VIKYIQEPYHRNQEKSEKFNYNRDRPSIEAIFSYDNKFFSAELDISEDYKIEADQNTKDIKFGKK